MQNKVQELTDKLYNEGLSKGRQEADQLLAAAKKEAQEIIAKAKEEASAILSQAEKDAEGRKSAAASDIRMASGQAISALKQTAENLIVGKAVAAPVAKTMSDPGFVADLLKTVVASFKASDAEAKGLDVILPASMKDGLEKALGGEISKVLGAGVEAKAVKGLADGFKIGPKEGGWQISFTADDFTNLVGEYLRPATRKILFEK